MIRGAQKKMIVVRTHDSRMFEEAYFVMRHNAESPPQGNDILREANRIIQNNLAASGQERAAREKVRRRIERIGFFLLGCLGGGGSIGLLWWLL